MKTPQKCQKCPDRDKCCCKRMVAMSAGADAGAGAAAPALRETMQINVGGVMTTVYKDEIEKELYKALHEPFMLNYGA